MDMKPPAIEEVIAGYHPDTQVRVELFPYDSAQGADTGAENIGLVVFEGVLERNSFRVASVSTRSKEDSGFIAVAMPWIDNRSIQHLITGRWMRFLQLPLDVWDRVESPTLPAAFNYRGRGNMDADDSHRKTPTGVSLTGRPFTHDDDPSGEKWTVREALKSILVQWLFGDGENARDRVTGVEVETLKALESGEITDNRFKGLDDVLPETDVSGMRVFEAVEAVCKAGGFEMAIGPDMSASEAELSGGDGGSDRRYQLKIWRRHSGPFVDLLLPKRGKFPSSAAETLRRANFNRITGMRDNAGITNHVFARGRVLIEAGVELKPLWNPDDIEAEKNEPSETGYKDTPPTTQFPAHVIDDAYHQKHVQGGSSFGTHGHVGRFWGIDCTGKASTDEAFYITDPYQHAPSGFDWLEFLGIPTTGEEEGGGGEPDPLTAERTARHIDADTDPIRWSTRVRRALPLRRAADQDDGRRYVLEVSETLPRNGMGTPQPDQRTWTDITDRVSFTTLVDFFGIKFTGIPNLAAVNAATPPMRAMPTRQTPPVGPPDV